MTIRGIYHAHSLHSHDGTFSMEYLKEALVKRGLQFIIMNEHAEDLTPESYQRFTADCKALSDETFLFIPGLEVPYEGKVHVGCFPGLSSYEAVPMYREGITTMRAHGAITIYHHPSKQKYFMDPDFRALLDGVEIWNSRYEGKVAPSERTIMFVETHFSDSLQFGGLDIHNGGQFGGPCLQVDVARLHQDDIVEALRSASFRVIGTFFTQKKVTAQQKSFNASYWVLRKLYVMSKKVRDIFAKRAS